MRQNTHTPDTHTPDAVGKDRELRLDLHIHSEKSMDGRMTLEEIVTRAKAAGLNGAAVCDHDRVLSEAEWRAVQSMPWMADFLLIPGVEVSTEYGHLLGWFVTRPMESRLFAQAVEAIHAQGGIAVLAHPFEHSTDPERIAPIVPLLDGVEVWNGRAERKNRRANAQAETFAAAHGLRRFAGSDAHVAREIGNGVTIVTAKARTLEAAKEALLTVPAHTSGRRGKAADTAASQWTRRRKSGAGWLSYCKWALFAVKCLVEDWITGA